MIGKILAVIGVIVVVGFLFGWVNIDLTPEGRNVLDRGIDRAQDVARDPATQELAGRAVENAGDAASKADDLIGRVAP
ncbi:MAG: hypothetical protein MPK62_00440 [Alphaproteobacteria bacterium]|nr:hypothetical protein [Alphaproteobacteria bacterium]MDA8029606.1 hypothetical protein [Alphaproteobacteria bacterium]